MSDLIDRQKAIEKFKEYVGLSKNSCDAHHMILSILRSLPSKNIKGKWQRRKGADCWECSQCHAVLENDDLGMHNFYFCYHCGANMMNKSGYMDIEEVHYE